MSAAKRQASLACSSSLRFPRRSDNSGRSASRRPASPTPRSRCAPCKRRARRRASAHHGATISSARSGAFSPPGPNAAHRTVRALSAASRLISQVRKPWRAPRRRSRRQDRPRRMFRWRRRDRPGAAPVDQVHAHRHSSPTICQTPARNAMSRPSRQSGQNGLWGGRSSSHGRTNTAAAAAALSKFAMQDG